MRSDAEDLLETADRATLTATSGDPSPPCRQKHCNLSTQPRLGGRRGGEKGRGGGVHGPLQLGSVARRQHHYPGMQASPRHAVFAAGSGGSGTTAHCAEPHGLKEGPCSTQPSKDAAASEPGWRRAREGHPSRHCNFLHMMLESQVGGNVTTQAAAWLAPAVTGAAPRAPFRLTRGSWPGWRRT